MPRFCAGYGSSCHSNHRIARALTRAHSSAGNPCAYVAQVRVSRKLQTSRDAIYTNGIVAHLSQAQKTFVLSVACVRRELLKYTIYTVTSRLT